MISLLWLCPGSHGGCLCTVSLPRGAVDWSVAFLSHAHLLISVIMSLLYCCPDACWAVFSSVFIILCLVAFHSTF